MCEITSAQFTVNGKTASGCKGGLQDRIGFSVTVNFTQAEAGQSYKCYVNFVYPNKSTYSYYASQNPLSVPSAGTYTYTLDSFLTSTGLTGIYNLTRVTILTTGNAAVCDKVVGQGLTGSCLTLDVSQGSTGGGASCTTNADCNDPAKICLLGSCQSKVLIYGAVAFFAFMMISKQRR